MAGGYLMMTIGALGLGLAVVAGLLATMTGGLTADALLAAPALWGLRAASGFGLAVAAGIFTALGLLFFASGGLLCLLSLRDALARDLAGGVPTKPPAPPVRTVEPKFSSPRDTF